MKRGDFVVYAMNNDIFFGRICAVQGHCLTIIPTNKDKHRSIRRLDTNVVAQEMIKDRLKTLNEIS